MTSSKEEAFDHVTTSEEQPANHVTTPNGTVAESSAGDNQDDEMELTSTSEISTQCDLSSLSCSALPDKTSAIESHDQDVLQSISAPELPQREEERYQERPVPELVKPVLSKEATVKLESDQELPDKQVQGKEPGESELNEHAKVVQQKQENPVQPEMEHKASEPTPNMMPIEGTPIACSPVEGDKVDDQPNHTEAASELCEKRDDIITTDNDVTAKEVTAPLPDVADVGTDRVDSDTSTAGSEQASGQVIKDVTESRFEEVTFGNMNDKQTSGREGKCSQVVGQNDSTQCEENLTGESALGHPSLEQEKAEDDDMLKNSPSSHESPKSPFTVPESTPTSLETPPTTTENLVKEIALKDISHSHGTNRQTPNLTDTSTTVDTGHLQSPAESSPLITSGSLATERTLLNTCADKMSHSGTPLINAELLSTSVDSLLTEGEGERLSRDPASPVNEQSNTELFSLLENSSLTEREKSLAVELSPEPLSSPNATSLARDVQELLLVLQAPLEEEKVVRVPAISRNSRYYRVSVKGSTPKASRCGPEEGSTPKVHKLSSETINVLFNLYLLSLFLSYLHQTAGLKVSSSDRPQWGRAAPLSAVRGHAEASPFEVSGEFLSGTHQTIEEIASGHQDMKDTLQGRLEVSKIYSVKSIIIIM